MVDHVPCATADVQHVTIAPWNAGVEQIQERPGTRGEPPMPIFGQFRDRGRGCDCCDAESPLPIFYNDLGTRAMRGSLQRQCNHKPGPSTDLRLGLNRAAVFLHNLTADVQAEPCPFFAFVRRNVEPAKFLEQ